MAICHSVETESASIATISANINRTVNKELLKVDLKVIPGDKHQICHARFWDNQISCKIKEDWLVKGGGGGGGG